ncbi:hypothetical protein E4L95_20145 [Paracoccus liaowanqingii]|uniref:Dynamin n=1 Tax=Paracoccus liaowanqingii TaxID=2560053 RepID=A0A4P7HJH5_9RHOB|nr:hypothetical protein [Paracoccus liaowanqingii]QBX33713.1 hypothetical protein E4191_02490 [Paracoccus liaowanqingii]TGN44471.1 hypothetical protein E4L95_20145 [Paracoccus liaowanqingii]
MADRNNNGLYFIVGGIVVVVALLFFFMSGSETGVATTDPVAGGDTNVTVETPAADPATGTSPVTVETDSPPAVESPAEPAAPAN